MNEPATARTLNPTNSESWFFKTDSGFFPDTCTPEGVPITELPQPC